jgi:hypothetical protein
MSTYSQLPAALDIQVVRGDELNFVAQFTGVDLTTGTLSASVYDASTTAGTTLLSPSLSVSSVTSGSTPASAVSVGFVESQTSTLSIAGRYRWFLRWVSPGGVTRTYIAGNVLPYNP